MRRWWRWCQSEGWKCELSFVRKSWREACDALLNSSKIVKSVRLIGGGGSGGGGGGGGEDRGEVEVSCATRPLHDMSLVILYSTQHPSLAFFLRVYDICLHVHNIIWIKIVGEG